MKAYEALERLRAAREMARRERSSGRKAEYREAMKLVVAREAEMLQIITKRQH